MRELHQVCDAEERTFLAEHNLRIKDNKVCPLPWNGANSLIVDLQQEPHAVSVVPLAHTDELLPAEWMERVRYPHKALRSDRRVCILDGVTRGWSGGASSCRWSLELVSGTWR